MTGVQSPLTRPNYEGLHALLSNPPPPGEAEAIQAMQNNPFHQKHEIIQLGLIFSSNGIAIIQKLIKIVRLPNLDETSP